MGNIKNFNKLLILSIFLILVFSIGSVSASDNSIGETLTLTSISENTGSFTDLQNLINNNVNNSIELTKDYAYNSEIDSNYRNGLNINNENFKINGNNHTIDGVNSANIIRYNGVGTLTIENLKLVNGASATNGGAITVSNSGTLMITGSSLINNNGAMGGAIYSNGITRVYTSHIINNTGNIGSGIYSDSVTIQYCIITGNSLNNKVIYGVNTSKSDVSFNWWGKNQVNINELSNINTESFVQATANYYESIMVNLTSQVIVNLDSYILRNRTYYLGVDLPSDNVKFSTNFGDITKTDSELINGEAETIFRSTNTGNATITALIDDEVIPINIEVTPVPNTTLLITEDFIGYYGDDEVRYFTVNLTDILGNPIIGQHIALNLTRLTNNLSKVYYSTNDWTGLAKLQINLAPGWYSVQTHFYSDRGYEGSAANNSMRIFRVGLSAEDITINNGENANYQVILTGQTIANQNIQVNVNRNDGTYSRTYTITTNANGEAELTIPNLYTGTYTITSTHNTNTISSLITVANKYTITVLNWGTGGDITKNTPLYNYILKTTKRNGIVDEIIEASKDGTVLIKFGNGNGKTVFINAGIHGNELPSQAAAYQTAEYLAGLDRIDGTIYMICSLIPYTSQLSVREYNGVDPNRQSKISGSVANRLINLAVSLDVETFADMHGTKNGGLPGKNVIMAAYSPNSESATMATTMFNDIKQNTGETYETQIVDYAGQVYPTALQDNVNLAGIPAVTGEVLCQHSTITTSSTHISYNYHMAFLRYNGFNVSFNSNPN